MASRLRGARAVRSRWLDRTFQGGSGIGVSELVSMANIVPESNVVQV
jgi:hypothetical protein